MKGLNMTKQEIECVPFDSMGKIAAPPAEIVAALKKEEPEKFSRLTAMLRANIEADDAEKNLADTQKNLYAAVADAQRLSAAYRKLFPPPTHVDERRRVIAARAGNPLPPAKVNPLAEPAAIALDEAEALAVKLRADLETAKLVLKNRRATLSETILGWQGVQPKRDTAYLVRENSKAEIARKMARIEQGLSPEEAVAEHVYLEPIDRVMAGGRGSANVNWRRQPGSWRGAPSVKAPSAR
jgi:hypothetical protein